MMEFLIFLFIAMFTLGILGAISDYILKRLKKEALVKKVLVNIITEDNKRFCVYAKKCKISAGFGKKCA